jgi:hypothetical protein
LARKITHPTLTASTASRPSIGIRAIQDECSAKARTRKEREG